MSSTFWKDVRHFHQLLNLAHDGVLTSTELTVTFPKVLEGTFGLRGHALSPTQYRETLESYLNRLYTGAYPEYFASKLVRNQQPQHFSTDGLGDLPEDPKATRNELPLLLTHFEQDFVNGLSKEEEAVLQVDLQHSITALNEYYKAIDRAVKEKNDKYLPVLIRALYNTGYINLPQKKLSSTGQKNFKFTNSSRCKNNPTWCCHNY